uniref:TNFR-Cys domain-containing protein n=1 Tax=Colobus angolensis palliatus TaxID=336983 RepID=A0A2K5H7K6_COLAP
MGNSYYNIVATLLLVLNFERTRSLQHLCSNCPAGTFCDNNRNQICSPCPPNSFSSAGGQRTCDICRQCKGVFKTRKECSSTSNAECDCISGYHCLGAECSMCEQDCNRGQELTKKAFMRPVQTTQEEDGCSCRFPEEEEGGCEL